MRDWILGFVNRVTVLVQSLALRKAERRCPQCGLDESFWERFPQCLVGANKVIHAELFARRKLVPFRRQ